MRIVKMFALSLQTMDLVKLQLGVVRVEVRATQQTAYVWSSLVRSPVLSAP